MIQGELKCPAEENVNCGRSPPTSVRKNSERTGTRTNKEVPPLEESPIEAFQLSAG
jgi:hypothetical protein